MTDKPTRASTKPELTPSVAKVVTALHRLGEATAAATATEAGLGYSTTTPKLRTLENAGLAEPTRGEDGRTLWRLTDAGRTAAGQAAAVSDGATADAEQAQPAPAAAPVSDPDPDPHPLAPAPARAQTDGDLVTVVPCEVFDGLVAQLDPDTAAPDGDADTYSAEVAAALDHTTTADSQPSDQVAHHTGDEQQPERESDRSPADPVGGDPGHESNGSQNDTVAAATGPSGDDLPGGAAHPPASEDAADPVESAPPPADTSPDAGTPAPDDTAKDSTPAAATNRRAAGSLRGAILDILEANPDQQYKVSELCKLIDKANEGSSAKKASAGAVTNAATKLAEAGRAVLAVEKPATFALPRSGA